MRIGFIGGGTMAEAILSGVLDRELASPDDIAVSEVIEARRDYLSGTLRRHRHGRRRGGGDARQPRASRGEAAGPAEGHVRPAKVAFERSGGAEHRCRRDHQVHQQGVGPRRRRSHHAQHPGSDRRGCQRLDGHGQDAAGARGRDPGIAAGHRQRGVRPQREVRGHGNGPQRQRPPPTCSCSSRR